MGPIPLCLAVFIMPLLGETAIILNGYDLVFKAVNSKYPRALLTNEQGAPVGNVAKNAFTICLFVKMEDYDGLTAVNLFSFASPQHEEAKEIVMEIDYEDFKTNLYLHGNRYLFSTVPPLDEWAHICVTWESRSGRAVMYVNVVPVGTVNKVEQGYEIGGNGYLVLGQSQDSFNSRFNSGSGIRGKLTQFHLWNRVLTRKEVKQSRICQLEGNVVSWGNSSWNLFDEVKGLPTDNPCIIDSSDRCKCNSTLETFQSLLLNSKMEFDTQFNKLKETVNPGIKQNEKEITTLKLKNEQSANEIDALKRSNSQHAADIKELTEKNAVQYKDIADLQQKIRDSQEGISNLKHCCEGCETTNQAQQKRIEELENQFVKLKESTTKNMNSLHSELKEWMRNNKVCPQGFTKLGRNCYYFSMEETTDWDEALRKCQSMDSKSRLAVIDTDEEWNRIKDYLNSLHKGWWLDGRDSEVEGKWKWMRYNQPFEFNAWCPYEPNDAGGNEDCLHISYDAQANICWNDLICTTKLHFVCEYE